MINFSVETAMIISMAAMAKIYLGESLEQITFMVVLVMIKSMGVILTIT